MARFAKDPTLARLPIAAYTCPLRFKVRPQSFSHLLRRRRPKSDGLRPKIFLVAQLAVSLRILFQAKKLQEAKIVRIWAMQSSEVEHGERLRCHSEVGASDRDATTGSERSRCHSNERSWCHSEREQCKPVWRRKWLTTLAWGSSVSRALKKQKLGAMVVLRFFPERWVAKWTVAAARRCPAQRVFRETERGSTMYRRTWRLPSRCCLPQHRRVASERSWCHSDPRVRQSKWENDWGRTLKRNGQVYTAIDRRAKVGSFAKRCHGKLVHSSLVFLFWTARVATVQWFGKKIRSVSHCLQPPTIDKASGVKRENVCKSKAWSLAWKGKHSLRTLTIFRAPFSTTFRRRIFLKPTGIDYLVSQEPISVKNQSEGSTPLWLQGRKLGRRRHCLQYQCFEQLAQWSHVRKPMRPIVRSDVGDLVMSAGWRCLHWGSSDGPGKIFFHSRHTIQGTEARACCTVLQGRPWTPAWAERTVPAFSRSAKPTTQRRSRILSFFVALAVPVPQETETEASNKRKSSAGSRWERASMRAVENRLIVLCQIKFVLPSMCKANGGLPRLDVPQPTKWMDQQLPGRWTWPEADRLSALPGLISLPKSLGRNLSVTSSIGERCRTTLRYKKLEELFSCEALSKAKIADSRWYIHRSFPRKEIF